MSWFREVLDPRRAETLESQQMPVDCGSIEVPKHLVGEISLTFA
jgi:hypothetical protein